MTRETLNQEISEISYQFAIGLAALGLEGVLSGLIDKNDKEFSAAINLIADGVNALKVWMDG